MFKFIHAADLHLDSPLRGLERYEGAPVEQIRQATRRAVQNLVELTLAEKAAFLLISGDLYDGDWKDYSTGLFFCQQMARLREADVTVVWIRGNHDAASRLTQHLRPSDNVHELSHARPVTLELDLSGAQVAVHGQGFPKVKILFMSGYSDHAALRQGVLKAGVGFIQKPFAPQTLLRKMREGLEVSLRS